MQKQFLFAIVLLIALALLSGCSKKVAKPLPPDIVEPNLIVTADGNPLERQLDEEVMIVYNCFLNQKIAIKLADPTRLPPFVTAITYSVDSGKAKDASVLLKDGIELVFDEPGDHRIEINAVSAGKEVVAFTLIVIKAK